MATTTTKTSTPDAIQIIHDELTDIRSKIADNAVQTERLQRIAQVDLKEMNVGKLQSEQALLRAVRGLTEAVNAQVVSHLSPQERCDLEGNALYQANKASRQAEVRRNVAHIAYLSTLRQETTFVCPCGRHTGIKFVDDKGTVVVENMCPKEWWIKQSRLAYSKGQLSQFLKDFEYSDYLSSYKIG